MGRVSHLSRAFAGPARRPQMGAVGGEGAQLPGSAVQHDDRPGGETGGATNLGEEVLRRPFEQPEGQGGIRGDLPRGDCSRHSASRIDRVRGVGVAVG